MTDIAEPPEKKSYSISVYPPAGRKARILNLQNGNRLRGAKLNDFGLREFRYKFS